MVRIKQTITKWLWGSKEMEEHPPVGIHVVADLLGCRFIQGVDELPDIMAEAATASGATVLSVHSESFPPQHGYPCGQTIMVILSESHLSIHTYPETGAVFIDCFTCGMKCKPEKAIAYLINKLIPTSTTISQLARGFGSHQGVLGMW